MADHGSTFSKFMDWASDEITPLNIKGMNDLIETYIEIWYKFDPFAAGQNDVETQVYLRSKLQRKSSVLTNTGGKRLFNHLMRKFVVIGLFSWQYRPWEI